MLPLLLPRPREAQARGTGCVCHGFLPDYFLIQIYLINLPVSLKTVKACIGFRELILLKRKGKAGKIQARRIYGCLYMNLPGSEKT